MILPEVRAHVLTSIHPCRDDRLSEQKEAHNMKAKNTICLWFDKDAHEAARFYAATFPDSEVIAVHEAPVTTRAARRAMS